MKTSWAAAGVSLPLRTQVELQYVGGFFSPKKQTKRARGDRSGDVRSAGGRLSEAGKKEGR